MTFKALVLAGTRGGRDAVADYAGVTDKALIVIRGETMLAHVVGVLREAGAAQIVVAASSDDVRAHCRDLQVEVMAAAAGPSESVALGLERLGLPLLVTTADHALLRTECTACFIAAVSADADAAVLLARRQTVERDVGRTKRTYFRFADDAWSGCNLFYLSTPKAGAAVKFWQSVERDRKRPWRIVRRLGPMLLLRYLMGRLTLASAVMRLGKIGGFRAQIIESSSGLAAVDVDTPADLDLVRRIIAVDSASSFAR